MHHSRDQGWLHKSAHFSKVVVVGDAIAAMGKMRAEYLWLRAICWLRESYSQRTSNAHRL